MKVLMSLCLFLVLISSSLEQTVHGDVTVSAPEAEVSLSVPVQIGSESAPIPAPPEKEKPEEVPSGQPKTPELPGKFPPLGEILGASMNIIGFLLLLMSGLFAYVNFKREKKDEQQ